MRKKSPAILYLTIIAVILTGVLLFVFKDNILEFLRRKSGVDSAARVTDISTTVVTVATSTALDTSILQLPRFTGLVNHVINYDFDNICWRPDASAGQITVVQVGEEAPQNQAAARVRAVNCVQGNSAPFRGEAR